MQESQSYYTTSHPVPTYIDESVVATQKRRAIETLRASKQAAIESAQQQFENAKAQAEMEAQARFEMAKASVESRRMQELMNLEQLNAHDRMELEQAVQTQRMHIETQALALEQQARQQELAKSQYENFVKFSQQNSQLNSSFQTISPRLSYHGITPPAVISHNAYVSGGLYSQQTPVVSNKVLRSSFNDNK